MFILSQISPSLTEDRPPTMADSNTILIVVAIVAVAVFLWWAIATSKREGYADQVIHYGAGGIAGPFPSYKSYPDASYDKIPQADVGVQDPYDYKPSVTLGPYVDSVAARHRHTLGSGGVDINKTCSGGSLAKLRFANSAGMRPLESMD